MVLFGIERGTPPREPIVRAIIAGFCVCLIAGCASTGSRVQDHAAKPTTRTLRKDTPMHLGNFSVSLAVKDIAASRAFYETLGFRTIGGDHAKKWLILQNDTATIGLFQ